MARVECVVCMCACARALLNHTLNGRWCVRAEEDLTGAYCVLSACALSLSLSLVCAQRGNFISLPIDRVSKWPAAAFCVYIHTKCVAKVSAVAAAVIGICAMRVSDAAQIERVRVFIVRKINLLFSESAAHLYRFARGRRMHFS